MANALDKVRSHSSAVLRPGESFVAAVPLTAHGTAVRAGAYSAAGGLIGGMVGATSSWKQQAKDAVLVDELPPSEVRVGARGAIAAATEQRLIVFQQSAMGRPKEILGEWPVDEVHLITNLHRPGGLAKIMSLLFVLPDRTVLSAECTAMGGLKNQIASMEAVLGSHEDGDDGTELDG